MPVIPGDMGIKSFSYEILVVSDGVDSWEECEDCIRKAGGDPTEAETTMLIGKERIKVELQPIFADTEVDRNPICEECSYTTFIFEPTGECIDTWKEQLKEYIVQSEEFRKKFSNTDYLDRVAEAFHWMGDDGGDIREIYEDIRKREQKSQ